MQYTACFTGHRKEKLGLPEADAKELLREAISQAVSDGFTTYITGMAEGIDVWAAEIVLDMKNVNPDIRLICAIPYDGFGKRRTDEEKERYKRIFEQADATHIVCEHYSRVCFQLRNKYMVDNSSLVIAAYNGEKGGYKKYYKICRTGKYNSKKYLAEKHIIQTVSVFCNTN